MTNKNYARWKRAIVLGAAACALGCSDGADGMDGADGTDGAPGTNGQNGTDGQNGAPGTNGQNGTDGQNGAPGQNGQNGGGTLLFEGIGFPSTDAEKRAVRASATATVNGQQVALDGYQVLARTGDMIGGNAFGVLIDETGAPLQTETGSDVISTATDFTSLLRVGGRLFSFTHLEDTPGGVTFSEVAQDASTGALSLTSTAPVDLASVGGIWIPCAGSVTPWQSHMGSEEYPPDAKAFEGITDMAGFRNAVFGGGGAIFASEYFGVDTTDSGDLSDAMDAFRPYRYGFAVELSVDIDDVGTATPVPVKRYAMGRMNMELAYVMPDQRTVFLTDDGTDVGLFMFIADRPGDLSQGHLYAVRWNQLSAENVGDAYLDWVSLGHADDDDVDDAIDEGVGFADIFDITAPLDAAAGTCPATYRPTHTEAGFECLRLLPTSDDDIAIAARLETRRVAAYYGATTEFRKEEGITFDPTRGTLYLAMSEVSRGMGDGGSNDVGGPNHVRVATNNCGAVYALPVAPNALPSDVGATLGTQVFSAYVPFRMSGVVWGRPDSSVANNSCHIDGIANPDNVTAVPGYDVLVIGEDTGSGHQNDAVWAYDLYRHTLTRILTTPYGAETTSPYFHPNIGGHAYLMTVVQHPYGESDEDQLMTDDEAEAYVGYIGAFPRMD